ncbi:MAG: class I SAM-dependent methyltransferase [Nanoarchaeota archaeon]|nr:class I SAM-dependent methyltransferase [Nanoarchaeota archaeon]
MGNEEYRKIIDQQSAVYDKERVKNYFLKTSDIFKKIIPNGSSVIEIGSGTGLYVIDLIKNGRYAIGVDYSEKMNRVARNNSSKEKVNCKFVYADVEEDIPLREKFDFALLIGNWEYFEKPVKVLENAGKVLKDDGKIIISTLNVFSWPLIGFLELTGIKNLKPAFWHFNSIPHRIRRCAERAGFSVRKSFFNYYFLDKVYILSRIDSG